MKRDWPSAVGEAFASFRRLFCFSVSQPGKLRRHPAAAKFGHRDFSAGRLVPYRPPIGQGNENRNLFPQFKRTHNDPLLNNIMVLLSRAKSPAPLRHAGCQSRIDRRLLRWPVVRQRSFVDPIGAGEMPAFAFRFLPSSFLWRAGNARRRMIAGRRYQGIEEFVAERVAGIVP